MAATDRTTLKTYFEAGDTPTEAQFATLIDSFALVSEVPAASASGLSEATMDASGETSLFIRYMGTTAPTLAKDAAGTYRLTVPTGTRIRDATWDGDNTTLTGSNEIKLLVDSDDDETVFANVGVINLNNNYYSSLASLGITVTQENTATGVVTMTFPNMNGFGATGFRLIFNFV